MIHQNCHCLTNTSPLLHDTTAQDIRHACGDGYALRPAYGRWSGSGLLRRTRFRHSPRMAGHGHGDGARMNLSSGGKRHITGAEVWLWGSQVRSRDIAVGIWGQTTSPQWWSGQADPASGFKTLKEPGAKKETVIINHLKRASKRLQDFGNGCCVLSALLTTSQLRGLRGGDWW